MPDQLETRRLPQVVVLPEAWAPIVAELDRAAEAGRARTGSPDEAVFVPLCAPVFRPGRARVPRLQPASLGDLDAVVVAHAFALPQDWVEASAARIRFRAEGGVQARFEALVDAALARFARLELLARGHSHPFDCGSTRPSGIDRVEHLAPCLAYNRGLGLDAGFTFIAVRALDGAGWALHGFATEDGQTILDLGLATVVPDGSPWAALREPPWHATDAGRAREARLREARGAKLDRLPLGWTRLRAGPNVWALPPGFPAEPGARFVRCGEAWAAEPVASWEALEAGLEPTAEDAGRSFRNPQSAIRNGPPPCLRGKDARAAYYARVAPLYGDALSGKTLGVVGGDDACEVASLLARCGLTRFALGPGAEALPARLRAQNPLEDRWVFTSLDRADVAFAAGELREPLPVPAWRLSFLPAESPVRARLDWIPAGEACAAPDARPAQLEPFDRADALNRAAALVRASLLRGAACEPAEVARFLEGRARPALLLGHARWPWWLRVFEREDADAWLASNLAAPASRPQEPAARRGRVLVIGCGSLGSVAALRLAPRVEALGLSDPETVSIENPVRQAFEVAEVGQPKAEALARRVEALGARAEAFVRAEEDSPAGAEAFAAFVDRFKPDLAVLATGTGAEYAMARVLRERGIPHAAGRCYARARYFEVILVDGSNGPCFHCLREQVHTGPAPSLTPEQAARYDPDYRPGELNAEPASAIESGRCAEVLARAAWELLKPPDARPEWLRATLEQRRTCLLGANHAEFDAATGWAYGLDAPGKVATYGVEDIAGARPGERCEVCGQAWLPAEVAE
ncbi:MAG: ThiF family adenylyltransferase [Planctomycetota bacterium]|nr:ThiF family adenylyltransferase [Planctomycetota bacterium]